jgi:ABC-2 type transport system permease protein
MLHRILLVAKRDYLATITTKAFWIALVLGPIMMSGGLWGVALLRATEKDKVTHVAVIDHGGPATSNVVKAMEARLAGDVAAKASQSLTRNRYVFDTVPVAADSSTQMLDLSDQVRAGKLGMFLDVDPKKVVVYSSGDGIDDTRVWLTDSVNAGLRNLRMAESGIDEARAKSLLASVPIDRAGLFARDAKGGVSPAPPRNELTGFLVPIVLMVMLMVIVMGSAAPMLTVIAEDKAQRVFEMLLPTITPFELMAGKVLASIGRSMTFAIVYLGGGLVGLQGAAMIGLVPFHVLPWFLIYVIAEVAMLSALGAALGAAAATPRDAQQFAIVMTLPVMLPMFFMIALVQAPNGTMAKVLSFLPPLTPMVMMLRQAMPTGVPAWQPWLGLVGVIVWTVFTIWVAARIFRVGILMQGKQPLLGDLVRMAIKG